MAKSLTTRAYVILMVVCLGAGGILGYYFFSDLPGMLLPKSTTEYTFAVTSAEQLGRTQLLFITLAALAFVSVPLSVKIISLRKTANSNYQMLIIFFLLMLAGSAIAIFYYQNHFSEMFATLGLDASNKIQLEIIPFNTIPVVGILTTIVAAAGITIFQRINNR